MGFTEFVWGQWSSLGSTIAVGGFLRAVLVAKVDAAADVRHLTFAVDSGAATPAPPLGWHVPLKLTLDGASLSLSRFLSIFR